MSQEEGVVKYSLEFKKTEPISSTCKDKIEVIREDMYALNLIGAYDDGIGFGNISLKIDNSDKFVITGTQTGHLKHLHVENYSLVEKVDFDTFTTYASGACQPSSEAITHACIYALDAKIKAIIHVHNEKLWRYMLEHDYISTSDVEYGSLEMTKDIQQIYSSLDALENCSFVMKGHFEGVFVFAEDIEGAKKLLYQIMAKML
ncbi:MAG TPA: class II aldolase/adducin family protein [Sulfurospirillum arcachonense]|nr:class II aldolase/adducin family protein [Arcobacter sp.]HIP45681.1 class II aldolase/adducin family protein [Sulfurospirillum arcachonense]